LSAGSISITHNIAQHFLQFLSIGTHLYDGILCTPQFGCTTIFMAFVICSDLTELI
jgi:hypothetical protein